MVETADGHADGRGPVLDDRAALQQRVAALEARLAQHEQALAALAKREAQFRSSIENMMDSCGIYTALRDEQGRIVDFRVDYVNKAACRSNRMAREAQVGRTLLDLLPGHRHTSLFEEYCGVVESGEPLAKVNVPYEDSYDGEWLQRYFDIQIVPCEDGFLASWRDVTERKRTYEALEEASSLLDALFQSAPIGLGFWDREVRFTRINNSLAALNGLPVEAHIGKRPSELLPDIENIEGIEAIWRGIINGGDPILNVEVTGSTLASAERRVWREHFFPVNQQDTVIGVGAVVEDVTAFKQAEAERERLVRELAAEQVRLAELTEHLEEVVAERTGQVRLLAGQLSVAEQEERQRVAQILHDHVQQILYGIQMRTHLLELDLSPQSASAVQESLTELKELAESAIKATRGLAHEMTPPILNAERISELLAWLANHMQALHGLQTEVTMQSATQLADKNRRVLLFHVVRELLFNVVKHAGVMAAAITVTEKDGFVQVTVRDEGQGFDASGLAAGGAGQGLGLSSLANRLQLFRGDLAVRSAPGQGTEVTIALPL